MSVRPVDMVMLQQINEVSHIKQSENARPMQEQVNIVQQEQKQTEVKSEQVNKKDNVDSQNSKYDARDKSSNEYEGQGSHGSRKKADDGVVKLKSLDGGGFDIKV